MKKACLALFTCLFLSSCTENVIEELEYHLAYNPEEVICYVTEPISKGRPINNVSQVVNLGVFCSYTEGNDWNETESKPSKSFNRQLLRNTSTNAWEYVGIPEPWEPGSTNHKYTFFSYAPYASGDYSTANPNGNGLTITTTSTQSGYPILRYTVPTTTSNQPDLMIAIPQFNRNPTGNAINLSMQHALTCVGFQVKGDGQRITGIKVRGVSMSGSVKLNGSAITWTTDTPTTSDLSALIKFDPGQTYFTAQSTLSDTLMQDNGYLMMLPQVLGTGAQLVIAVQGEPDRIINLNNYSWTPGAKVTYNITLTPYITLSPSLTTIGYAPITGVTNNLEVKCNPNVGNKQWTLTSSQSWLSLSLNADGSGASNSVTGQGDRTVYTVATQNESNIVRTAQLTIVDGTATINATFIQNINPAQVPSSTPPTGVNAYVGAFWKSNQKGERIIRIDMGTSAGNMGNWSAYVAKKDARWLNEDDIILSPLPTSDPGVSFTNISATPGDAETYTVTGTRTSVNGNVDGTTNTHIMFRVGLNSTYNPTFAIPARYGMLYLTYGTPAKTMVIFLRQGEDPDFLMRDGDNLPSGTTTQRPNAKKIATYNLTAATFAAQTNRTDSDIANVVNAAVYTDFPTQAGALFQWASPTYPRYAYAPFGTTTNYSNNRTTNSWDNNVATNETCPRKIRLTSGEYVRMKRIEDGSTSSSNSAGPTSNSEIRQSLFWNPPMGGSITATENRVYGYYADGYFDRRMIRTTSGSGTVVSSVSTNTRSVAHIGLLMYNPYNMGSLFMPMAGYRTDTGVITADGIRVRVWTTGGYDYVASKPWFLISDFVAPALGNGITANSQSIRCVIDNMY
ncbi:MAG: hypothetical protein ACRDDZ_07675 [Marinifilaceae bacterium]